jgi:hypothetical protein
LKSNGELGIYVTSSLGKTKIATDDCTIAENTMTFVRVAGGIYTDNISTVDDNKSDIAPFLVVEDGGFAILTETII